MTAIDEGDIKTPNYVMRKSESEKLYAKNNKTVLSGDLGCALAKDFRARDFQRTIKPVLPKW